MRTTLENLCNSFISNRDTVKSVFKWENDLLVSVCGATFMGKGIRAEEEKLATCKNLLKSETGVFSNFRGNVELPLIALLAASEQPDEKMKKTLQYYELLKKQFSGSDYVALAAAILADIVESEQVEGLVDKAKLLYDKMKKEHPLLTSKEDSVYAVLMAASQRDETELIQEAEECYRLLKERFSSSNDVQAVAHVLAIAEGTAKEKCSKVTALYDELKARGLNYGKNQELVILASLSLLPGAKEAFAEDIQAVDTFLAEQKGYGLLGLDKKTRLMHAAMIVSTEYCTSNQLYAEAMAGTVSTLTAQQVSVCALQVSFALLVAQQAALCAVLAASALAVNAANHN